MSLEKRIIKRWQDWWTDKCFELRERHMKELINIALEEVQKNMVEPRFTTQEATAVEHALDMLRVGAKKDRAMSDKTKIGLFKSLATPEVLSALGKLQMHLDDILQAQEMVKDFTETESTDE